MCVCVNVCVLIYHLKMTGEERRPANQKKKIVNERFVF